MEQISVGPKFYLEQFYLGAQQIFALGAVLSREQIALRSSSILGTNFALRAVLSGNKFCSQSSFIWGQILL